MVDQRQVVNHLMNYCQNTLDLYIGKKEIERNVTVEENKKMFSRGVEGVKPGIVLPHTPWLMR